MLGAVSAGARGDDASGGQAVLGAGSTGAGGDDASGGQAVLGAVSTGAGGDNASGGQAMPKVTTFMSYNMTGADKMKCKWIKYVAVEQGVNYAALQEHFKTVKSTEQWFRA